jgi:hypothetical protein
LGNVQMSETHLSGRRTVAVRRSFTLAVVWTFASFEFGTVDWEFIIVVGP